MQKSRAFKGKNKENYTKVADQRSCLTLWRYTTNKNSVQISHETTKSSPLPYSSRSHVNATLQFGGKRTDFPASRGLSRREIYERRETSTGARGVLLSNRRPHFWTKPTGFFLTGFHYTGLRMLFSILCWKRLSPPCVTSKTNFQPRYNKKLFLPLTITISKNDINTEERHYCVLG